MESQQDQFFQLQQRLNQFAQVRDWEQFHSPKNLSMALIAEAAELIEHFQWLTEDQSRNLDASRHEQVRLEMADIFIYLLRLASVLDIDLIRAANDKTDINDQRYPADRVRGSAQRADEYESD